MEEQLNAFLDTEFFDPSKVKEGSPLKWFANLVENDYATAEALYTSFFIAFMVLVTQELVRMQLYGDRYVPF
jgi:ABC-type spermidine/putrescine transport system permease subunit II